MIRRCHFARALTLVEDCGVAAYVENLLCPPGRGGRPRQIRFAVFLAAVVVAAQENRTLSLVNVHKVLTVDLARSYQVALGIVAPRADGTAHTLTIRQVRYMLEALERRLAFTEGRAPDLDEDDRAYRRQALQNILDMLLSGTIPTHLPTPAAYALDGTAFESWAVGRSRRVVSADADHAPADSVADTPASPDAPDTEAAGSATAIRRSFDPDAAYGYQTKTYDNRADHCFGYHAFAVVGVPAVGADPDTWPKLVERLTVRPANAGAAEPALALLDSLRAAGRPAVELLADREFSYKKDESWAKPLRERGIAQVIDMHDRDRGVRDYNGIAMIDGTPHCAAVLAGRDDLVRISRPANLSAGRLKAHATAQEAADHAARVAEIEAFRAKIAERELAAFRRVSGPDLDGKERWECPAQAGKVICANCPLSLGYPEGTPVVTNPHEVPARSDEPAKPAPGASREDKHAYRAAKADWDREGDYLRCCRQRTVTIPGTVVPKLRQRSYWGSDEWIASYSRRSHIEGAFGNIKSAKTTSVTRGWIYVVGIIKNSLMLVAVAVATNIRLLRKWADRTGDRTHPLTEADPPAHGFEELDGDGNPDRALAPPTAA